MVSFSLYFDSVAISTFQMAHELQKFRAEYENSDQKRFKKLQYDSRTSRREHFEMMKGKLKFKWNLKNLPDIPIFSYTFTSHYYLIVEALFCEE